MHKHIFFSPLKHLLPIEWVMLAGLLVLLCGNILADMPAMIPSAFYIFLFFLYFMPTYILLDVLYHQLKPRLLLGKSIIPRTYITFFILSYLVYDIKSWSHLLNDQYYDDIYLQIDIWLAPLISLEKTINDFFMLPVSVPHYIYVFNSIFYLVFPVCYYAGPKLFHACSAAYVVNAVLGGISYSIAPALGPFIYWSEEKWDQIFHIYYEHTIIFKQSNGEIYDYDKFALLLGAMPSMHISIPLIFTWYMWKAYRPAGVLGMLITTYCFMHAKFTGFHYYADFIGGVVLAIISILLANWLTNIYLRCNKSTISEHL